MRIRLALALTVLPLLTAANTPNAADGHLLRPFVHKGDQWTTSTEFEIEISRAAAAAEEGKEKGEESSWRLARRDQFDSEVLEAKSDLATKLRRNYVKSTAKIRSKTGKGDAAEKQEDSALHQAALVLEKEGESTKLTSGGGSLSPEIKASLDLDLVSSLFLPSEKAEEGKEWTVEGKRLGGFLTQQVGAVKGHEIKEVGGKLKVSIKGIKDEKGKKYAELPIEGDLSFTLNSPKEGGTQSHKITWAVKGALHFDPTTSRPSAFTLEGKIEDKDGGKGNARLTLEVEDKIVPSGEAIRLLARFHQGDVSTNTTSTKFSLNLDEMTMLMNGKKMDTPVPEVAIEFSSKVKVVDEILEATEGKAKKLRREFVELEFGMKGPFPPQENPMEELEGKAIIVEEDNGELHSKPDAGAKIEEKLIKGQTLGDEFRIFLPEEEVKKGSTWSPDEKKLVEMFKKMLPSSSSDDEEQEKVAEVINSLMKKLSGGIDCKLVAITQEEGSSIARISLKGSVSIEFTQDDLPKAVRESNKEMEIDVAASGKFEGEMLFDIKAGKPVKTSFAGPLSIRAKISQSNEEAGMDFQQLIRASGNLEMESGFGKGRGK